MGWGPPRLAPLRRLTHLSLRSSTVPQSPTIIEDSNVPEASPPRVAVIGTGGSISTPGRDNMDLYEYSDPGVTLEIDELLELFPEARRFAEIIPVRFRT